ncbi:hypothetical protein B1J93_11060 [Leptospira kirschneri serovar Pomona]|uniref:Phosphoglycerate mutase n=1 Tax=Leptospira kirschneri serovar Pomona TaxID=561005 RepID=A0A1T1DNI2_9LEPT|nr:hypothetical protein B1J93_11060 [Leptospira kirschneri serovar Pomona]
MKFFIVFFKNKDTLLFITHNYIIKYLIFYMESAFCDKINGTQFYRDQQYKVKIDSLYLIVIIRRN